MSSITNSNNNSSSTSTPSIASDWTTVPDAQLNWDDNNMEEIATAKFQERCWCKKIWEAEEHKCWEEEERRKAEEAKQRCKAEEARACTATEEKQKSMGVKKRLACVGCVNLKEKCEWPAVEIGGGSSKQVTSLQGGKKKKRARKSTMADNKVVVEGWKMGQPEARGNDVVAEAICQLNALENLVKTQQNISWKMSWHYTVLEDMLGELGVFAADPGEPLEEEDMVEEEDLKEARGELEGLGPIVNIEEEMEREQQGESQDKGKGKEKAE
ncbi:hypothetical protein ID866_12327 [Astraeus odoratus]|nr:hypothetical protein ID866_12327 [Astraeus odoratus]